MNMVIFAVILPLIVLVMLQEPIWRLFFLLDRCFTSASPRTVRNRLSEGMRNVSQEVAHNPVLGSYSGSSDSTTSQNERELEPQLAQTSLEGSVDIILPAEYCIR